MGDAQWAPNPFFYLKKRDFCLFWLNWDNHSAVGPADKNRDYLISIQTLNQTLELLYASNISIGNPNNHVPWAHPCPH
jgi:hypothetical protein